MPWLILAGMGLAGAALWRWLGSEGLEPLREDETSRYGVTLFFAMMVLSNVAGALSLVSAGGAEGLRSAPLEDVISVHALTTGLSVLFVLAVASRFAIPQSSLGLRPHVGPPAPALAAAAWLMVFPFLSLASLINQSLMNSDSEALQEYVLRFMGEDGAAQQPVVWVCIVVAIPIAEEIIFRGAFYGGLRRLVPPGVAMLLSGLLFGVLHDGAAVLPVALLGVTLAWLYERTGSLLTPCLVHCLHNGVTLLIASQNVETVL